MYFDLLLSKLFFEDWAGDQVRPEKAEYQERHQHSHHKNVREVQHTQLELVQPSSYM